MLLTFEVGSLGYWLWHLYSLSHSTFVFFFLLLFSPFALSYVYVRLSLLPSSFDPPILFFFFSFVFELCFVRRNFLLVHNSDDHRPLFCTTSLFLRCSLSSFRCSPPKMADNSCFLIRRPQIVICSDWHLQTPINTICTLQSKTPPRNHTVIISSSRSS